MKILEKELEDYIFENYNSIDELNGNYILRQINLKGYGILDLLIIEIEEGNIIFKIIELKQDKLDWQAISQVCRYIKGLKYNLEEMGGWEECADFQIKGYLIGESLSQDICYITDCLKENYSSSVGVITYKLDIKNGITFNYDNQDWYPTNRKTIFLDKYIKKAKINYKQNEQNTNDKN